MPGLRLQQPCLHLTEKCCPKCPDGQNPGRTLSQFSVTKLEPCKTQHEPQHTGVSHDSHTLELAGHCSCQGLVASETQQGWHMCARKEFLTEPAKALAMAALNFAMAPQSRRKHPRRKESPRKLILGLWLQFNNCYGACHVGAGLAQP